MERFMTAAVRRRVFFGVALLLLLVAVSQAQADVKLRWKFKPGEKLGYEMGTDMTQAMVVGEMTINVKMAQKIDMSWEVTQVTDDGTATVTQTIDRVRMDMSPGPGQQVKYDSQNPDENKGAEMLLPIFDAMVGKPITMQVTPRGEIKDLKISQEMLDGIKKSFLSQLGGMFSEEGMKQMISRGMLQFPEEAVTKGTSWESVMEMPNAILGKQVTEMRYEYAGPEMRDGRELDKLDADMTMKFEQPADAQAKITIKNQSSEGTLYFDNTAGRLAGSSVTSKMSLEIVAGGMSIEQDITTLVTMKQTSPEAAAKE